MLLPDMFEITGLDNQTRVNNLSLGLTGIICGSLVYYFATHPAGISLFDGEYHPWSYDSFYLGAIIREAVEDFPAAIEFDDRLHPKPEHGPAAITFTWAYVGLIAAMVKVIQLFVPSLPVSTIQAFVPPIWGVLSCILFIGLCRRLGLGYWTTAFGALGFALAPFVRERHLLGNIDHHFMEMFFLLLIMFAFLGWITKPDSRGRAIFAGFVLGISVAFHFALFIAYIPIAVFMLVQWIRGQLETGACVRQFVSSVLAATAIAVLPTTHFRSFEFSYYLLSWFHVYWAIVFCAAIYYMHRQTFSSTRLTALTIILVILAIPAVGNFRHGADFLAANLPGFTQISETQSVFAYLLSGDLHLVNLVYEYYTGLLFAFPLVILLLIKQVRVTPDATLVYAICSCTFGAVLLLAQLRFSYHAPYALLIPALLLYEFRSKRWRYNWAILTVIAAVFYAGPVSTLTQAKPLGGVAGYQKLLPFYRVIGNQCRQHPGVLLAFPDEGHFLRYHTDCKLVASNMLASSRDFEYRALALKMLGMSGPDLIREYDWIDYIYLRREGGGQEPEIERELNRGLRAEVLLDKTLPYGSRSIAVSSTDRGLFTVLLQTHNRW